MRYHADKILLQDTLATRSMTITSNVFLVRPQRQPLGAPRPRRHRLRKSPQPLLELPLPPLKSARLPRNLPPRPHRHRVLRLQVLALVPAHGQHLTPRLKLHWLS
jgi:hypothetical protein